ncbi:hypothetical protein [Rhodoferax ferrireducens]|uniref:hypothetical protein n=1 Tax=Rhodoferax ferrireducens TaxID=192843 RepID=UPI003BB7D322
MANKEEEKGIQTLIPKKSSAEMDAIPNTDSEIDRPTENHPINSVLDIFLGDIRSIQKTHMIVLPHVFSWLRSQHEANAKKLAKYASKNEDQTNVYHALSAHEASEMLNAIRALDGLGGMRIPETLQRSLFTQLFSEYDAFVGALLKVIYKKKSELLKGISRQLSFADLLAYEDLNAIKLDMLEKEVETFRRDSYIEQFVSLETKFGLKLRTFPEWGEFIEMSQRRNLVVHNGGVVSDQYFVVCDREGYIYQKRPKLGDTLKLGGEYFSRASIVVSKVAFMLCHTLWRKLFPNEKNIAHEGANQVLFDLLTDKRWKTANEIAKFTLTEPMKDSISELDLRIRTINAAIAAKFSGNEDGCKAALKSLDWTATYRDFKLAIAVLNDDFPAAAGMMKLIGKQGELFEELSYHDWPLFHKFRESPEFLNAYAEVYGMQRVFCLAVAG